MLKKTFFFCLVATAITFILMSFNAPKNKAALANTPKNVIFILADDHRYDAMGFMNKFSGLKTPNLDKMAAEGMHLQNAFVSTALCSPSWASILSGQYAHTHQVVDNSAPLPKGTKFFPTYLQKAGYKTAFLGKWHMGDGDDAPQPGFDYWLSFKGQGVYYNPTFNINGKQVKHPEEGAYTTDLLTDYALEWMGKQDKKKPFFLYLSHKAVHADFQPAPRHKGIYKDMPIQYPSSMYLTKSDTSKIWGTNSKDPETGEVKANLNDMPEWVKKQRYSWHGVDYLYHGTISFNDFYRQYCETLLGVDESVGRVMKYLEDNGLAENTLVIYMGDNGFSFGEHGLIDKRHAYEESMRVPMLVRCRSIVKPQTKLTNVIQNIDVAPTILGYAGLPTPPQMQGKSFLPLLKGQKIEWKDRAFYEYFWEYSFPQTPTIFAVRTDRYKYIFNHGVWNANELYDLQADPMEINNLIRSPEHQAIAKDLRDQVWTWLEGSNGLQIPLKPIKQKRGDHIFKGTY